MKYIRNRIASAKAAALRNTMRGYKLLKAEGDLEKPLRVSGRLAKTPPSRSPQFLPFGFFPQTLGLYTQDVIDKALQQILFKSIGWARIAPVVHRHKATGKPIRYPLPKSWQLVLEDENCTVASLSSRVLFHLLALRFLLKAVFLFFALLKQGIKDICDGENETSPFIYFTGGNADNLPCNSNAAKSYDICSWLRQHNFDESLIFNISVDFELPSSHQRDLRGISYKPNETPKIQSVFLLIRFLFWGLSQILQTTVFWIFGSANAAFLIQDSLKVFLFRHGSHSNLAKAYIFTNSNHVHMPLWVHEISHKDSEAYLVFYSTNNRFLVPPKTGPQISPNWSIMSWQNYLVFDDEQSDFVSKVTNGLGNSEVTGPIWWADCNTPVSLPCQPDSRPVLAVFDVQPVRPAILSNLGSPFEFYSADICTQFISDLAEVADELGWIMVLKRKRDIGNKVHKRYLDMLDCYQNAGKIISVDSCISPFRVMDSAEAVVSMPFTSTAQIACKLKLPSCYYDPKAIVDSVFCPPGATPLIQSNSELREWLSNLGSSRGKTK